MTKTQCWGVFMVLFLMNSQAEAQSAALQRARDSLMTYRVRDGRTLGTLTRLQAIELRDRDAADEAQFLHSVVATDLLVIAHRTRNERLLARLTRTYNTRPEHIATVLREHLRRVRGEIYETPVAHALRALDVLEGEPLRAQRNMSLQEGVLLTHRVRRALRGSQTRMLGRLSALADDPCADNEDCPAIYSAFDGRGRRALFALTIAQHMINRLDRARQEGDPLSDALLSQLAGDRRAIEAASIRPSPRLPDGTAVVADDAPTAQVDTVIIVRERWVEWGRSPRVTFTADGPQLVENDGPTLPETARVRLRGEVRSNPAPIAQVVEMLSGHRDLGTVAIAAAPDVPAYIISRVVLSARQADVNPSMLIAAAPDGGARAIPSGFRRSNEGRRARVQVHVRLGGFEVRSRRGRREIRGFDMNEFRAALPSEREQSLVRAMATADAGKIYAAAFALNQAGLAIDYVTH